MSVDILNLVIVIAQTMVIFIAYKAENERKQKQSTIEYLTEIRELYKPLLRKLYDKYPNKTVINIETLDNEMKKDIKELLSIIERLSVGLNTEVYNFDIFSRISGAYFLGLYYKLYPYIEDVRKNKQESSYIEFEAVIDKIKVNQKKYKPIFKNLYKNKMIYS